MPDEPDQNESLKPEQEGAFERIKREIKDFRGYDEMALDQYQALSFYLAQRRAGLPLPMAAAATCQNFGHDAPRGMCLRCGLGVDLTRREENERQRRLAERDTWLAQRTGQ